MNGKTEFNESKKRTHWVHREGLNEFDAGAFRSILSAKVSPGRGLTECKKLAQLVLQEPRKINTKSGLNEREPTERKPSEREPTERELNELVNANLVNASLVNANLANANLVNANLVNAD